MLQHCYRHKLWLTYHSGIVAVRCCCWRSVGMHKVNCLFLFVPSFILSFTHSHTHPIQYTTSFNWPSNSFNFHSYPSHSILLLKVLFKVYVLPNPNPKYSLSFTALPSETIWVYKIHAEVIKRVLKFHAWIHTRRKLNQNCVFNRVLFTNQNHHSPHLISMTQPNPSYGISVPLEMSTFRAESGLSFRSDWYADWYPDADLVHPEMWWHLRCPKHSKSN